MEYIAAVVHAKAGGYIIFFPDFPEAYAPADTREKIRETGEEFLAITAEEYAEDRREMPQPTGFARVFSIARKYLPADEVDTSKDPFFMVFKTPERS